MRGAPAFLLNNVQYEVVMGSIAYGVADDDSDMDVYGFAMAPKDDLFPHLRGEVAGFDDLAPRFTQFQQHKIVDAQALGGRGREYDLTLYDPGTVRLAERDAGEAVRLVLLDKPWIMVEGKHITLTPGMAVSVEVKTGQRRVIDYFLSPILQYGNESIKERCKRPANTPSEPQH